MAGSTVVGGGYWLVGRRLAGWLVGWLILASGMEGVGTGLVGLPGVLGTGR